MRERKHLVFEDFMACAEFLINEGFTSPAKLCIQGSSNGGLLVCAVANQRPELLGCVVCQAGLLDVSTAIAVSRPPRA